VNGVCYGISAVTAISVSDLLPAQQDRGHTHLVTVAGQDADSGD
jgi:hypothetical protein